MADHEAIAGPTPESVEIVQALYRHFLGREAEARGLRHWCERLESSESAFDLLRDFLASKEFRAKHHRKRDVGAFAGKLARLVQNEPSIGPLTIVDVGAQTTGGHVYKPLLDQVPCRVIGFEPLLDRLREREQAEMAPDLIMRPLFIGDGRQSTFHINQPDATSSLLPLNTSVLSELRGLDGITTISTENVETVTLDDAISDVERVDFLKLDIQGFEHTALNNARAVLSRTLVVHCEVEFIRIYEQQPLFAEVDQLLRSEGFRFVDFSHLCRYSFANTSVSSARDQLGWGDAVYLKEEGGLPTELALIVQSLITASIYGKPSLAERLLRRYDAKTGSSHHRTFCG